ncbi:MAG TPA: Xaa-Pro peptidase family protein [Candidatus Limnocylindrales bacterium]|nr:Xaa-Pro peptidase family protein [Candidatus Limnocylindrales bacterium]
MTTATRPTIPAARHADRLERAMAATAAHGLDALLVGVGPDLDYLTGYRAMPLERLTMLAITPADGGVRLVVPRLEEPAARVGCRAEVEIVTWEETDDPHGVVAGFVHGAAGAPAGDRRIEVAVSDRLMAMHLLPLQERLSDARFTSARLVLRELRIRKDEDEIELLRLAGAAADRVVAQIAAGRLVGRTEVDVAAEVRERLIAEGHERADFGIVASGPNSASPHHEASDRVIQAGEPIVLDIGGVLGGYGSDTTRTLWVTGGDEAKGPDEAYRHLFGVLHAAQQAASAAARPGVPAESIDRAARDIIDGEGYAANFFHRTGHGIGLEGHEDPYLVAGNAERLGEGMAFSIEPGIYLPGRYGARIEDIVVCGPDGPIVLNNEPRELRVVSG